MKNEPRFGHLITDDCQDRDAVHVAVVPVEANSILYPAQHVGLAQGRTDLVGSCNNPIGVVDPFLKDRVHRSERFWLFLYPGTITSLRHAWTHPAFEGEGIASPQATAMAWLEQFCRDHNPGPGCDWEDTIHVGQLIAIGQEAIDRDGPMYCGNSQTMANALHEHRKKFWENLSIVTGSPQLDDLPGFKCAC